MLPCTLPGVDYDHRANTRSIVCTTYSNFEGIGYWDSGLRFVKTHPQNSEIFMLNLLPSCISNVFVDD